MRGKFRAEHYVRPAHVKAGFKWVNRHCIDNMYMKAVPGIDNSHRDEFQSSSWGTYIFLQLWCFLVLILANTHREFISRPIIQQVGEH